MCVFLEGCSEPGTRGCRESIWRSLWFLASYRGYAASLHYGFTSSALLHPSFPLPLLFCSPKPSYPSFLSASEDPFFCLASSFQARQLVTDFRQSFLRVRVSSLSDWLIFCHSTSQTFIFLAFSGQACWIDKKDSTVSFVASKNVNASKLLVNLPV